MKREIATACLLAILALGAAAHDLYLMPERFRVSPGETLTVGIHNGDAFPESQSKPPMERLKDATLHSAKGKVPIAGLREDGKRAVGTVQVTGNGYQILSLQAAPNAIDMDAREFREYLEEEGLHAVIDWREKNGREGAKARERYTKYAKALVVAGKPDAGFSRSVGLPIEIVLEKDPSKLKAGDTLPVRVLFRGAPARDIQVIAANTGVAGAKPAPAGRTNAQGRVSIPVAAAGTLRLHAIHMEQCTDPSAADWESFWATLTFQIP
jgi:uncharacterized GH25 family protein